MVNKDMNGFPVKKCSAFQFFKKRVRRWIKSPMVNVEKHPHASLKYPGSTVMNLPAGDSELEPPLCQTCLSDHPFQRGIAPQEVESCSWESQRNSKMKEPQSKGDLLPKPEPRTLWGGEDTVAKLNIHLAVVASCTFCHHWEEFGSGVTIAVDHEVRLLFNCLWPPSHQII
ncbi:uncharacterized protein ACIQIH_004416 [Cyanocitta cristata]